MKNKSNRLYRLEFYKCRAIIEQAMNTTEGMKMYFNESHLIECNDFWTDVFDDNTRKAKERRSKGAKYRKNKNRDILADFLGSNDIAKRFDFETVREARTFAPKSIPTEQAMPAINAAKTAAYLHIYTGRRRKSDNWLNDM